MKNRLLFHRILLPVCLIAALATPIAHFQCSAQTIEPDAAATDKADAASYRLLFRRAAIYKKRSDDATLQSQDKTHLRRILPVGLQLNSEDAARFEQIALDCQYDLAPLEAEIRVAIMKFKARFPGGKVPHGADMQPPPELATLAGIEDSVVLRYRDLLRAGMERENFQRTEGKVRDLFGSGATKIQLNSGSIRESSQVSQ